MTGPLTIRSVETFALRHDLADTGYGGSKVRVPMRSCTLVKVTTRDGVSGWGESFGPTATTGPALDELAAKVVGTPASMRESRWLTELQVGYHQGFGGPRVAAMSGLDIAMWDAFSRTLGVSISELLGGRARDSVAAYASTGYYRGYDEMPYLEEQLADVVANGLQGREDQDRRWRGPRRGTGRARSGLPGRRPRPHDRLQRQPERWTPPSARLRR